jgi:hypothetical protein
MLYVSRLLYIAVQVLTKVSIVLFFRRVFERAWIRKASNILIVLLVLHGLIFLFLMAFQCLPVEAEWDPGMPKKCLNTTAIIFAGGISAIIEDVVIVLLPLPLLYKLQMTWKKRFAVVVMLSLGSL